MGFPILTSLEDCADYYKTVEPFIPQLYALPNRLLDNGLSLEGLKQIYLETNPLMSGFAASILIGALALVVSEANRNFSQIDRMWSILPNLYVVHIAVWARLSGLAHERLDLIALATTIWSVRLTFNYWRKGGYSVGSEDYRWKIIMGKVPTFIFFLFNVTFISFIQSILLFLFSCAPAYVILLSTQFEPKIGASDMYWFSIEILLVFSEWVSDGQQWNYQIAKQEYIKTGKVPRGFEKADLDRGFIASGLWAYSRHPNFFAEQAIWVVLYQWSSYASNTLYSWAGVGGVSLVMLFQGSTWLTEAISAGKYTEYAEYQRQVGRFMPGSFKGYSAPVQQPKIIRTSEILKWQQEREKLQKEQQAKK